MTEAVTPMLPNDHALQRTRPSRHGCNHRISRAGSLGLGRSAAQHIEETNSMDQKPNDKQSGRSAAIAALLGASAGAGIGWGIWLATGNNAVAIGMAGPIALLINNIFRKVIK